MKASVLTLLVASLVATVGAGCSRDASARTKGNDAPPAATAAPAPTVPATTTTAAPPPTSPATTAEAAPEPPAKTGGRTFRKTRIVHGQHAPQ